jgi:hypothetical protein
MKKLYHPEKTTDPMVQHSNEKRLSGKNEPSKAKALEGCFIKMRV